MTIEPIRSLYNAKPFRPFVLYLTDGRQFPVRNPEFMAISRTGSSVIVVDQDGAFTFIDVPSVTRIEVGSDKVKRKR